MRVIVTHGMTHVSHEVTHRMTHDETGCGATVASATHRLRCEVATPVVGCQRIERQRAIQRALRSTLTAEPARPVVRGRAEPGAGGLERLPCCLPHRCLYRVDERMGGPDIEIVSVPVHLDAHPVLVDGRGRNVVCAHAPIVAALPDRAGAGGR